MTTYFFFPPPNYVDSLDIKAPISLRELCRMAGVNCRASGMWTERQVEIVGGESTQITAEPGDWGRVRIMLRPGSVQERSRLALAAMAYGMHDLVAKASISGEPWARLGAPRGRPRSGQALTTRERQQRFRVKKARKCQISL